MRHLIPNVALLFTWSPQHTWTYHNDFQYWMPQRKSWFHVDILSVQWKTMWCKRTSRVSCRNLWFCIILSGISYMLCVVIWYRRYEIYIMSICYHRSELLSSLQLRPLSIVINLTSTWSGQMSWVHVLYCSHSVGHLLCFRCVSEYAIIKGYYRIWLGLMFSNWLHL